LSFQDNPEYNSRGLPPFGGKRSAQDIRVIKPNISCLIMSCFQVLEMPLISQKLVLLSQNSQKQNQIV
jgi:hypothetical protein